MGPERFSQGAGIRAGPIVLVHGGLNETIFSRCLGDL